MVWQKGESGNPAGRKAGSQNKASKVLKEALLDTFTRLGGVEHMLDWASAYPSDFYRLFGKVMPVEIDGSVSLDEQKTIRIEFVEPKSIADSSGFPRIIDHEEKV